MTARGILSPNHRSIPVDRAFAMRLQRYVARVGEREAARRLGVGKPTLEAARDRGALLRGTFERLTAALEREELSLLAEVGT